MMSGFGGFGAVRRSWLLKAAVLASVAATAIAKGERYGSEASVMAY
jgi:hypothetical protein